MSESLHRDLGMHQEAIGTLKADVSAMRKDLDEIKIMLSGMKGGARTLMAVGMLSGTLGAAIAQAFRMMKGGG